MSEQSGSAIGREFRAEDRDHLEVARELKEILKGDWGELAVAYRDTETGEIVDWIAYNDEHNRVSTWWPDYFDEPVWNATNMYRFLNPLRGGYGYFTVHEWPDELDPEAEVCLPI